MIHPSYTELMQVINDEAQSEDNSAVVSSRYSIVLATSKRARQIIGGDSALVDQKGKKPLSVAVDEFYKGKVKILAEEEEVTEEQGEQE